MSYYNGMDTYYYRYDLNNTYMVIPRVDDLVRILSLRNLTVLDMLWKPS